MQYSQENEVFMSHLCDLNSFITYALAMCIQHVEESHFQKNTGLLIDPGFLIMSHDRLRALTHNQGDNRLHYSRKIRSTAQIKGAKKKGKC